jgi:hypothetical protein
MKYGYKRLFQRLSLTRPAVLMKLVKYLKFSLLSKSFQCTKQGMIRLKVRLIPNFFLEKVCMGKYNMCYDHYSLKYTGKHMKRL